MRHPIAFSGFDPVDVIMRTRPVVQYLKSRNDQVASLEDICDNFDMPELTVRAALQRLQRVNRVAEIHPGIWHLE